ncbi:LacI family DNA-binding transcriptional regulator [Dokdonella fugitiva]|jgi:LacI family transcriptional regulator|uniref:LacI family DNA-binding transcriptional regulator n=1 Tax=Dokdonella fugitiva TaxID=328517 RepID=UPI0015FD942A|nr:LacI family DNA-binding transcriptional regulator [Dokdonella fugitiva]MBA8884832.1 LacI family transcriptional regulator [Dokdonella fugitiva]
MAVTIKDVAKAAGVSVASVSRALNGRDNVTDETRHRILDAASKLRYRPNDAARSLITRRTRTIGAVLPDLHGEFFSELIRGIDVAARAQGLHLLVSSSHGDADEATAAIRSMQGRVDGLLVMSPHVDASFLHESLPEALPAVLMNAPPEPSRFPTLNLDNHGGAVAMTRHLLARGCRRIAMIGGPAGNLDADERRRGWLDALAAASLARDALLLDGDFSEESGHAAGLRIAALARRPDAVFAANDMMAVGCLIALAEHGVHVPGEIALAGFDDVPIARYVTPQLTTVRVRIADLGRAAFNRLVAELEAPGTLPVRSEVLPCEIVVRASSGTT